ncbi:alpha-ketoglutarate-dependent dioxygenase AlkB family protein [Aquihabitans sp. McL0605]|uniref:alpha-ketoglutarate-dependent dioxygenase AlkB family protein n=1 Tax=Aquihabitans sp. McL0605 TaxID=3415671 RepID=UPI003CFB01D9
MVSLPATLPDLTWQGTLLGHGEPAIDPSFGGARRVELTEGAWVDVVPGWLTGADTLFATLLDTVAWKAHEVPMYEKVVAEPRLSAWWGSASEQPWPEGVRPLAAALGERYGTPFDSLGANLYRDGTDSVAWHGDRVLREQPDALVAVVSLGSTRRFLLRPKGGGASVRLDPAPGDLLVMGGSCQRTWQHCVPKSAAARGPRLSVTLRPRSRRPGAARG